jgi:putative two-component system response regulator
MTAGIRYDARTVPARALALSAAAFLIPLVASWSAADGGAYARLLVWIAALVPAFLLSYYKGWAGSAVALAAGMAVMPVWSLAQTWRGLGAPSDGMVGSLVGGYLAVCVGLGFVTELLHRERRSAEEQALTDPLTGLPNRRHVEVFLDAAMRSARATGSPLAAVALNLDRFKWLNDTHGHAAGDEVLRSFADLLRGQAGDEWLCGRTGGDEFLVVLPHTDVGSARRFAEDVRNGLAGLDLRWQPITVSAGATQMHGAMSRWQQLLAAAEAAVSRAKERGRDRIEAVGEAAQPPMQPLPGEAAADEADPGERPPPPRGLVALADADARNSVRRVLELNGLRVEEFGSAQDVPFQMGLPTPAVIVVADGATTEDVRDRLSAVDRVVPRDVPRVLFLPESARGGAVPTPADVTVIHGAPTGEGILPFLGGLLSRPVHDSGASSLATFGSRLAADDAPLTAGRVIVVDDERSNRVALQRTLEDIGFQDLVVLGSGEEALVAVVETPPDLLILDLHMPGMDGFHVLETLQPHLEADGFLPILVVTGDKKWEHRQRALRMGAKDFLNKPFDVSELGARVLNLLQTRKLHLQMRDTNALLEVRVHQRTRELGIAKNEILFRLARAAEYRDDVTGRHAERVGVAAALLAETLGLDASICDMIRQTAPLHDVGKIAIPDAILLKPGRLTEEEMDAMRRHTLIGADLLANSTSELVEEARVIALTHHERWDGTGYPRGLRRKEIPVQGRLVAVADAMDALTHERPYKPAFPFEEAMRRLLAERGAAFDPAVITALEASAFRVRDIMLERDVYE